MARDSANDDVRSVYMTFPDEETAASIVARLLEERLIACANLLPGARSLYRWQGSLEDEAEVVAFAKTVARQLPRVVERVRELHPYETPCVVGLEVEGGYSGYLDWVRQETGE